MKNGIILAIGLITLATSCSFKAYAEEKESHMMNDLLSELKPDGGWMEDEQPHIVPGLKVRISRPVTVALSKPGENRWGYHQFPAVSRLPDGRLLATYSTSPDYDDGQGTPGPAAISSDGGLTWTEAKLAELLLTVPHSVISAVEHGEFLCVPRAPAFDITGLGIKMPDPLGAIAHSKTSLYDVDQCDSRIGEYLGKIESTRWRPATGQWAREQVVWDARCGLARMRNDKFVFPSPSIENSILRLHGKLYTPDYNLQRKLPDGTIPKNFAAWCLESGDNGRSWKRRGLIAHDPAGQQMMAEPCLAPTTDGGIVCVIRTSTWILQPLLITRSSDQGATWEEPARIHDFGVMPQIMLLPNGIHALSSGRPGVFLMFSTDGAARKWTPPVQIVKGNRKAAKDHSCGYTRMLAIMDNTFLLIYSNFKYTGSDGRNRRAIEVRRITVERAPAG